MKKIVLLTLSLVFICGTAFSGNSDRILLNPQQPYESLGYLEHKISTSRSFVKAITFGIVRRKAFEKMARKLDKGLLKEARRKYGADAISNITYWPSPESQTPIDYLYGRAEMIRFKKFPVAEKQAEVPVSAPEPARL